MNTTPAPGQILITKRDGRLEPIDIDKIHRVVTWPPQA